MGVHRLPAEMTALWCLCVAAEGLLYLDTLCAAVQDTIFCLEVTMTKAVVVHGHDSIDELLEIVCHHWLRQLLVRCTIEQIQQVRAIHQLPLQTGLSLQMRDLCQELVIYLLSLQGLVETMSVVIQQLLLVSKIC